MNIYIALLRGINVGGQKQIKMAELKTMFENMGFTRVQTYIQSGNVLFESQEDASTLRPLIEQEIATAFGFQVPVVLRTADELVRILENSHFTMDVMSEGESLHATMLADTPSQEGIDRLLACHSDIDEFRLAGREVYILCRQSYHKTMFSNHFLEKKLGVTATTRNWRTINILADMALKMKRVVCPKTRVDE